MYIVYMIYINILEEERAENYFIFPKNNLISFFFSILYFYNGTFSYVEKYVFGVPTLPFINNIFYFDGVCAALRAAGVFRWFIMRGDFVQTSFLFTFISRCCSKHLFYIHA